MEVPIETPNFSKHSIAPAPPLSTSKRTMSIAILSRLTSARLKTSENESEDSDKEIEVTNKKILEMQYAKKFRHFSSAIMQKQLSTKVNDDLNLTPYSETVYASVLLADISGFTRLSAKLSAEELKHHINEYFTLLLGVVKENFGDVVKFLGDAVLILWPIDKNAVDEVQAAATLMACVCALQLLKDCGTYDRGEGNHAVSLRLHCGIGFGLVHCMCMGVDERWEFVVSGDPLYQVGIAESEAETGEVCVSEMAYARVSTHFDSIRMPNGSYKLTSQYLPSQPSSGRHNSGQVPSTDMMELKKAISRKHLKKNSIDEDSNSNAPTATSTSPSSTANSNLSTPPATGTLSTTQDVNALINQNSSHDVDNLIPVDHSDATSNTNMLVNDPWRHSYPGADGSTRSASQSTPSGLRSQSLKGVANANEDSPPSRTNSDDNNEAKDTVDSTTLNSTTNNTLSNSTWMFKDSFTSMLLRSNRNTTTGNNSSHGSQNGLSPSSLSSTFKTKGSHDNLFKKSDSLNNNNATIGISHQRSSGNNNIKDNQYNNFKRLSSKNVQSLLQNDENIKTVKSFLSDFLTTPSPASGTGNDHKFNQGFNNSAHGNSNHSNHGMFGFMSNNDHSARGGSNHQSADSSVNSQHKSNDIGRRMRRKSHVDNFYGANINHVSSKVFKYFVHDAARSAVENNTFSYLSELRNVVTLFIGLFGLEDDLDRGRVNRPQMAIAHVLACLTRYGGSLRQYVVDDKGCVIIVAFGLPGSSHEDNASRAVETAVGVRKLLQSIKVECKQGIAEGKVYCGLVGTSDRCEYAMMGCSVNLAARLMGKCKNGEILVNDTVHQASRINFAFEALQKVQAKGYIHPVPVFRPTERLQNNVLLGHSISGDGGFVGRSEELRIFEMALRKFESNSSTHNGHTSTSNGTIKASSTIIVSSTGSTTHPSTIMNSHFKYKDANIPAFLLEGEAGVGKTRLVAEVLRMAAEMNKDIISVVGTGSATQIASPYYVIRQLLEQVLGIKLATSLIVESNSNEENKDENNNYKAKKILLNQSSLDGGSKGPSNGVRAGRTIRKTLTRRMSTTINGSSRGNSTANDNYDPQQALDDGIYNSIYIWITTNAKGLKLEESSLPNLEDFAGIDSGDGITGASMKQRFSLKSSMSTALYTRKESVSDRDAGNNNSNNLIAMNSTVTRDNTNSNNPAVDDDKYSSNPLLEDLIPLLGSVFTCRFKETAVTATLRASHKQRLMEAFIIRILLVGIEKNKGLIMLDNLQWIDIYSLRTILRLIKVLTNSMIIATIRPGVLLKSNHNHNQNQNKTNKNNTSESLKRQSLLKTLAKMCSLIDLKPLQAADIKSIMEKCIGSRLLASHPEIVSAKNVSEVMSRAGGSPFHAMVLAQGLRKALATGKFTRIEDLPAGAHNIIVARFDQLSNTDQAILKTASVIGLKFSEEELRHTLNNMGSVNCTTNLSSGLHELLDTSLIVINEDESKEQHTIIFAFSDRTVQESIYDLMLATMREDIHGIVGRYLESKFKDNREKLEVIVSHFIRSNDFNKKIEYLKIAAENACDQCLFHDALRYLEILIKTATDMDVEDLFYHCYRKQAFIPSKALKTTPGGTVQEESVNYAIIDRASIRMSQRNGIDDSRLYPPLHTRWIVYSDIVKRFKLSLPDWAKHDVNLKSKLSYDNVCDWIGQVALSHAGLGNLPEFHNLSLLALSNFGIPLPSPSTIFMMRWDVFWNSLFSPVCQLCTNHRHITTASRLRVQLDLLQYEGSIFLLRGLPSVAVIILDIAIYLILIDTKRTNHTNAFFGVEESDVHFNIAEAKEEWLGELLIISDRLHMLLSVALMASESNLKTKYRITECVNRVVRLDGSASADDPIILLCRSIHMSAISEFGAACDLLVASAETASIIGDIHLQHIAMAMKSWFSFLAGNMHEASDLAEHVLMYASGTSHSCLHIWALELEILLKTVACDFGSAERAWDMIEVLHRTETIGPTTRAIIAFSLTKDSKFAEAAEHAQISCEKLAARQQCTPVGGFLLFCAAYAGLDVLEEIPQPRVNSNNTSFLYQKPFQHTSLSSNNGSHSKFNFQHIYNNDSLRYTKLGQSVVTAMQALESMVLKFPCLLVLSLTLTARMGRLHGSSLGKKGRQYAQAALNEIDAKLRSSRYKLSFFVFGYSYLHLQRALLCQFLDIPATYMNNYDSRQLSRRFFRKMGMTPAAILSGAKSSKSAGNDDYDDDDDE